MKVIPILKIFPLLFLAALLFPGQTEAQEGGKHHRMEKDRGAKHLEKMKADLELSAEQSVAIEAIFKEHRTKMENLRAAEEKNHVALKTLRAEMNEDILQVLDEEQDARFLEYQEQRKARKDRRQGMRKENREQWKAAKKELKAYRQKNIMPVLVAKRTEFDENISPESKLEIDVLRKEIKTIRDARRASFKGEGGAAPKKLKGHRMEKQGQSKGRKHGVFREHPELKEKALSLVDQLAVELEEVEAELAVPRGQWKADQKEIMTKYLDEEMMAKLAERKRGKAKERRKFSKVGFLLMQPQGHTGKLRQGTPEENYHQLRAYPNPASDQQTLEFTVAQKGMVTIQLIDNNGKVMERLFYGKMVAGAQSISVDLPKLNGNYYYYLITDKTGQSSLPVVIVE